MYFGKYRPSDATKNKLQINPSFKLHSRLTIYFCLCTLQLKSYFWIRMNDKFSKHIILNNIFGPHLFKKSNLNKQNINPAVVAWG